MSVSTNSITATTDPLAELKAAQDAAERRLAQLASRALAQPSHLIDAAVDKVWNANIVNDTRMLCALDGWIDALLTEDPGFLRHVFESRARWLGAAA